MFFFTISQMKLQLHNNFKHLGYCLFEKFEYNSNACLKIPNHEINLTFLCSQW